MNRQTDTHHSWTTWPSTGQASEEAAELYQRGKEFLRLFDLEAYAEAIACFRKAIAHDPGHSLAYAGLSETYAYWGFRRELNRQEFQSYYDLAYEFAETAVDLAPNSADAHRSMAVALRRGEKADAERKKVEIQIALEMDPNNAENWYVYWRVFGYDLSDAAIQKAIDLDPGFFAAHHDLSIVLCEHGLLEESLEHLLRALTINPHNSLAQYNLAMLLQRTGMAKEAAIQLRRAQETHPEDPLIAEGFMYLEEGAHV